MRRNFSTDTPIPGEFYPSAPEIPVAPMYLQGLFPDLKLSEIDSLGHNLMIGTIMRSGGTPTHSNLSHETMRDMVFGQTPVEVQEKADLIRNTVDGINPVTALSMAVQLLAGTPNPRTVAADSDMLSVVSGTDDKARQQEEELL